MIDDTGEDVYAENTLPAMVPTARFAEALPPALAAEFTSWAFALHNDMPEGDDTEREVFWSRTFGAYGPACITLIVNGTPPRCLVMVSPAMRLMVSIRGNSIRKFSKESTGRHIRRRYAEGLAWLEKLGIKTLED